MKTKYSHLYSKPQLTREEAIEWALRRKWEPLTFLERAFFQIHQEKRCMPFSVFHEAVEKALGEAIFTHQFASEAFITEAQQRLETLQNQTT